MRSVVVAKYVPWPPNSGDKRRTLGVVRALAQQGPVVVCAFAGDDEDAAGLRDEGVEVRSLPRRRSLRRLTDGLLRSRSLTSARFWDGHLHRLVREESASADVLVVEHVQLLPYARGARAATTVLDMHNVESSLTERYARSQRGLRRVVLGAEARRLRALEARSTKADLLAVVSEGDAALLRDVVAHPHVVVVPNAWDEPTPLPPAPEPVVSFVALLSWAPNVDAATWFTSAVWPLVRDRVPGARLQLVGRNPAPAVQRLAADDVQVTGTVPDLTPWYACTRVAVAPLRSGGGSRLKILEALAHARPVVATTVGAEGLEDLVGRGVVVADEAAAMAAEVVALLLDPRRATEAGERGATAVAADHSWTAATRPLVDALTAAGGPR